MVVAFKTSISPGERVDLVGNGAGVYDRADPVNADCQTPEQILLHLETHRLAAKKSDRLLALNSLSPGRVK